MNSFAEEYDPEAPVTNPYVDQNPFEILQEQKDEETDPDFESEDESEKLDYESKYDEPDESTETEEASDTEIDSTVDEGTNDMEEDNSSLVHVPFMSQVRTRYG